MLPINIFSSNFLTVTSNSRLDFIRNTDVSYKHNKSKLTISNQNKAELGQVGIFFALNFLPWEFLLIKMFEIEKTQPNFITVFPRIVSPLKSFRGNYSIYEVKNAIMRKLYENFHIFHFQKKIRGIRVYQFKNLYTRWA